MLVFLVQEFAVPNYTGDRDAMAEAVAYKIAQNTDFSCVAYSKLLHEKHGSIGAVLATAKQQAEAFLEVLGKLPK